MCKLTKKTGDNNVLLNAILKVQQNQEQMAQNLNNMMEKQLNNMMEKQNEMFDKFKDVIFQFQQVVQSLIPVQNIPTTTQHIPEAAPPQQLGFEPQSVSTHQSPSRHRSRSPRQSPSSQSTSTLEPITPPRQLGAQRTAQSPVAVVRPLRLGSENDDGADATRGGRAANTGGGNNGGRVAQTGGNNRGRAAQTGSNNRGRAAQTGGDNRDRPLFQSRYVWYGPPR